MGIKLTDEDLRMVNGGTMVPYQIQQGDTLDIIVAKLQKYNITKADILKWNDIKETDALIVGNGLKVFL